MYHKKKSIDVGQSAGLMPKNLQVVSFDADWREVYVGTSKGDSFSALCPNDIGGTTPKIKVQYQKTNSETDPRVEQAPVTITCAKWCPMDSCTVLVLGMSIINKNIT